MGSVAEICSIVFVCQIPTLAPGGGITLYLRFPGNALPSAGGGCER